MAACVGRAKKLDRACDWLGLLLAVVLRARAANLARTPRRRVRLATDLRSSKPRARASTLALAPDGWYLRRHARFRARRTRVGCRTSRLGWFIDRARGLGGEWRTCLGRATDRH